LYIYYVIQIKRKVMTLTFGKHKGQEFKNTPKSYQEWAIKN